MQFPEPDGPLTGFATRTAASCGVGGETVAGAERTLGVRVLAVDGKTEFARDTILAGQAEMVLYGDVAGLQSSAPRRPATRGHLALGKRLRSLLHRGRRQPPRLNPILVRLALAALIVLVLGTWSFHAVFKGGWLDAVYFVVATMTTTGYGDLTPDRSHPAEIVSAMALMLAGTIIIGLVIAFGASLLTRVHWVRMQGLRPVHRRGHIVVCGAGSIGSEVIDLLLALGKHLVVVEIAPDTAIIERAREQRFDLLTGDASRDATLDLCNLRAAHGLIAVTNVDTLNLEIALGARARNPTMPIVLRIAEASFAASIARHFEFETTYSAAALAAPAFVGLSHLPGSRGRVAFAGREFAVSEVVVAEDGPPVVPRDAILLAASRQGGFAIAGDFAELGPCDRALIIVPVVQFPEGEDALAAAAESPSA